MIADLKPYSAMKNSGVEWLGEVPEHWEVLPNRALFDEIKDRNCPDEQMLSVTIKRGVIKQARLLEDTSKKDSSNLDRSNYKLLQPGDIAYNKMRAWQGAIGASGHRGIISPAYVVQRPRERGEPSYFHHLFRIPQFAKEAERWSYGITSDMWSLRPEHFKLIYSCLPSLPEQSAIVRYLDHVDRRVRRLVRAKRKLIALLTEQKQAIIHRAVTRGLDPDVPLKDSGVEWLGEVPEHWESAPIKRLLSLMDYGTSEAAKADGTIRVLTMANIQEGEVVPSGSGGLYTVPDGLLLERHDLLFTRTNGNPNLVGKVGIFRGSAQDEVTFASYLVRLRAHSDTDPCWLHLLLNSPVFWGFARSHALVNLQTNLNSTRYGQFKIPLPSLLEQRQIAEWVERETHQLDEAAASAEREIELLSEYRTRLIADVVTGKLDVREAAAALPEVDPLDEVDEADDLDLDTEELDEALEEVEA